jgi:hypothetical protein
MPFLDDTGVRDEPRGPIWDAFAALADQIERLVAVNVGWAVQLLPGVLALAFPEWPFWLRIALLLYSGTALVPLTGALYGLVRRAAERDHLSLEISRELLRDLAVPSLRTLAPLFGTFGVLLWAWVILQIAAPQLSVAIALIVLVSLLWLVCATYWGPLLADEPDLSALAVARRSVEMVWRYPAETMATVAVTILAALVGIVSIGGLVLIAPVLVALLQTCRYLQLADRERARSVT